MKVKYYSEDGYEFDNKNACSKYEKELKELENHLKENRDKEYSEMIKQVTLNDVVWYKITSAIDFFIFDHKDDEDEHKSSKSFYDIFNIVSNMKGNFPFWVSITKDGQPITNKSLIDHLETFIKELREHIKTKKDEITNLKNLDALLEEKKEYDKVHTQEDTEEAVEETSDQSTDRTDDQAIDQEDDFTNFNDD